VTRYLHVQTDDDGHASVTLRTITELAHVASCAYAEGRPVGEVYLVDGAGVTELELVQAGDVGNADGFPTHGSAELRVRGTSTVMDRLLYAYC